MDDLVLIQQDSSPDYKGYCHQWQEDGDLQPYWGFGDTPGVAEEQSIYAERDEGRGFSRGFGNWQTKTSIYSNQNGWPCHTLVELLKDGITISSFSD